MYVHTYVLNYLSCKSFFFTKLYIFSMVKETTLHTLTYLFIYLFIINHGIPYQITFKSYGVFFSTKKMSPSYKVH